MKIAFIVDPLDGLKPAKDSSIAMMREAARRGHKVHALMRDSLCWRDVIHGNSQTGTCPPALALSLIGCPPSTARWRTFGRCEEPETSSGGRLNNLTRSLSV